MEESGSFSPLRNALARRHPSAFLLAAQLLRLVLYAVLHDDPAGRAILEAVGVTVLMLVVWVVSSGPLVNWVAWVLALPAIGASLLSVLLGNPTLLAWSAFLEAALHFYAAVSLIAYMMADQQVTVDELYAAGATFTLLAWGFAFSYWVCQSLDPGSFMGALQPDQPRTFIELLGLSFTNLTATGLGDVVPIGAQARVMVMLEQFTGIGYVAMVVSRLVALTTSAREARRRP